MNGVRASNGLDTTGEPQTNFAFSRFNRVRTVTDVTTNFDTEVTTDGTGGTGQGVGFTQHLTTSLDDVLTGPDHTDNGAGGHVFDQGGEETLTLQITVLQYCQWLSFFFLFFFFTYVFFEEFLGGVDQFKSSELITTLFEALDDFTNETTLDA